MVAMPSNGAFAGVPTAISATLVLVHPLRIGLRSNVLAHSSGSPKMVLARTPVGVRATIVVAGGLGPAAADGGVGGRHVVARGLDFLAVGVGLFVDGLEVAAQLGDELLAGH
jgi:hypothetical protein